MHDVAYTVASPPTLSIPSPSQGVWYLGPVPLRAYAFCIIVGILVGFWIGRRRWIARGGAGDTIGDVVLWAVPFGLVGARLYHVVTDYELYFGAGRQPLDALKVWQGGLGIWGAVAGGALGAWIACRRLRISFLAVADTLAPGIAVAQAIGRFGNYFNQELFGRPTTLPWGLQIDPANRPEGFEQFTTFHPTFLYESVWNLAVAGVVIWAARRFDLAGGRTFALYVGAYTLGRFWIEGLRIDTVNHIGGLRLNEWTSILLFLAALTYLVGSRRTTPPQIVANPDDVAAQPAQHTDDGPTYADPPADSESAVRADP